MRLLEQRQDNLNEPGPVASLRSLRLRWVWYLWFVVVAVVMIRGAIQPNRHNCFPCYRAGGLNWDQGNDLYQSLNDTCRYSPLVHAIFAIFSRLPPVEGAAAWRMAESIALLAALAWWLKSDCVPALSEPRRATLLLITIPLMMGNLYSAQSNALMMAGILVSWVAIVEKRWTIAAIGLALACYFKIYPLALTMLLVAIYPRQLGWRVFLALVAGALLPFLIKDPAYVARQYGRWFENLVQDDRSNWPIINGYRDGWMLIRMLGLPLSFTAYRVFSVFLGALTGLLVIALRRRGDGGSQFVNRVIGLGCCWMTLFGPATEAHTYILLAAPFALMTVEAACGDLPPWACRAVYWCTGSFLFSVVAHTTPLVHVLPFFWMPLSALIMFLTLIRLAIYYPANGEERAPVAFIEHQPTAEAWGSAA